MCQSENFIRLKHYFINESYFITDFKLLFLKEYDVDDIFNNDLDALRSRILFVQQREYSSWFTGF